MFWEINKTRLKSLLYLAAERETKTETTVTQPVNMIGGAMGVLTGVTNITPITTGISIFGPQTIVFLELNPTRIKLKNTILYALLAYPTAIVNIMDAGAEESQTIGGKLKLKLKLQA